MNFETRNLIVSIDLESDLLPFADESDHGPSYML